MKGKRYDSRSNTDPPSYQEGSKYPWVIRLKPMNDFRLWVEYSDGIKGEVDLSDMAQTELFEDWKRPGMFEQVTIGEYGEVYWTSDANLCPDSLYIELTEPSGEEPVHA
ncbi:MAG: DUF2442 domain-containing protein [Caldilineaceae bacterium]|nr:DUF2442 domain-containing protein [Caldilineaceae bacterium]